MDNTIICKECGCENNKNNIYCSQCGEDLYKKIEEETKTSHYIEILLSIITLLLFIIDGVLVINIMNNTNPSLMNNYLPIIEIFINLTLIILIILDLKNIQIMMFLEHLFIF